MDKVKTIGEQKAGGPALAVLFAGGISAHAFEPLAGGECAFVRALTAVFSFPAVKEAVVLLPPGETPSAASVRDICGKMDAKPLRFFSPADFGCESGSWSEALLCAALAELSGGAPHMYFLWADLPFVDCTFTAELFERHIRYAAEYTFADCYPYGLAPEIFAAGILPVLAKMAEGREKFPVRDSLFSVIQKDINSFDIETDVAGEDVRMLRVSLACDTLRNREICEGLSGIRASNFAQILAERQSVLRSRPAFFAFQVSGRCPFLCPHCPYPDFCASGAGRSPGIPAVSRQDFMRPEDFRLAAEKIAEWSEDAVISLSLWGECAFHPEIAELVRTALSFPFFSVLIETTGIGWQRAVLENIRAEVSRVQPSGRPAGTVNWIVSLDAVTAEMYGKMHGLSGPEAAERFQEALVFVETASQLFPESVYPQFLRTKKNECELEDFFRFWKEKNGRQIILKYDSFCSTRPDERPADLSPLVRQPCWHLKRDISILPDGTVPFCREDVFASTVCGNIFTGNLPDIFGKNQSLYEAHIHHDYKGMCGNCDEYYTFNF